MFRLTLALSTLFATAPQAGPAELEVAWRAWMKENSSTTSTLAIMVDGEIVAEWGHMSAPDASYPLASLSKAITGACVMELVAEGAFVLNATLSSVFIDRPDLLPDGKSDAGRITVAQLLTHTSGLTVDRTQDQQHPAWHGRMDGHDALARESLTQFIGDKSYFYNNENYSILGSVIQEVTGQSVEDACAPRVLDGLDSAAPSTQFGNTLAYAGWEMSAADYARFADGLVFSNEWPVTTVTSDILYGPGLDIELWPAGDYLSHSGSYGSLSSTIKGSFFASYPNGLTFVVIHDQNLWDGGRYYDLYDTLYYAALQ